MNYLKFGSSKKFLVFLHGWGADLYSFLWLKDYFPDFSLLFVDFAGFGKTPEPPKPYFVSDYSRELFELISKFEVSELILVGHSFGGRVAIKFLFYYQNNFQKVKLVLADSAGIKPRRSLKYYFKVWSYKFFKKFFPNSKIVSKFGSRDYKSLSNVMKQTFVQVVNEDLSIFAKNIFAKTLIVWGNRDFDTKIYMAKKFKKLIKNSKLCIINKAGHFSFLDDKNKFLMLLSDFVYEGENYE